MKSSIIAAFAALSLTGCIVIEGADGPPRYERDVAPVETVEVEVEAEIADLNPLDLRRTTLVVRDIEKSLALYRDALGMTVEYDQ